MKGGTEGFEERYYKKTGSTRQRDRMVALAKPCRHDRWQNAHGADKAKKGIAYLEKRRDWRSIARCAKCTGGGVYRVLWTNDD